VAPDATVFVDDNAENIAGHALGHGDGALR
jgi:hypothetical protein